MKRRRNMNRLDRKWCVVRGARTATHQWSTTCPLKYWRLWPKDPYRVLTCYDSFMFGTWKDDTGHAACTPLFSLSSKHGTEISVMKASIAEVRLIRKQITNIRVITNMCIEQHISLYLYLIVYTKSVDRVCHDKLWYVMKNDFLNYLLLIISAIS